MHSLKFYFLQVYSNCHIAPPPEQKSWWVQVAPFGSWVMGLASLVLSIAVFRFTRRKNDTDVRIKWFQELIYTPNKDALTLFYKSLHDLKQFVPRDGHWNEDGKIAQMERIKAARNLILDDFVDLIQPVAPDVHHKIKNSVEALTDSLTQVFDNDELKLENDKVYQREVTNLIAQHKRAIILAIFEYKGRE